MRTMALVVFSLAFPFSAQASSQTSQAAATRTLEEAILLAGPSIALLTMSSFVAGVTEEASFRGYMQGAVEQRYGLTAGILVSGTIFGVLHFPNHPNAVLQMLPYYIAVSALYGGLTWATNSILPALALHAGGDVWSLTQLWLTGRPEWQMSSTPPALVWETGLDARFVTTLAVLIALTTMTAALCVSLRRVAAAGDERGTAASG